MEEVWKDIEGYEGCYKVSSRGKVKSLTRKVKFRDSLKTVTQRILKQSKSKKGYKSVKLSLEGVSKTFLVHRLVGNAYIPNIFNKPEINHKDSIRHHNIEENLEWATSKENAIHGFKYGNRVPTLSMKGRSGKLSPYNKAVIQLDMKGNYVDEFISAKIAMAETGIQRNNISSVCLGKRNHAGGYKWKHKQEYSELKSRNGSKC